MLTTYVLPPDANTAAMCPECEAWLWSNQCTTWPAIVSDFASSPPKQGTPPSQVGGNVPGG